MLDQADGAGGVHVTNIFGNIVTVKSIKNSADGEHVKDAVNDCPVRRRAAPSRQAQRR